MNSKSDYGIEFSSYIATWDLIQQTQTRSRWVNIRTSFLRPVVLKLYQTFEDWNDAACNRTRVSFVTAESDAIPELEKIVYPWNFYPFGKRKFES